MGHLVAWQENALAVATELAVNETSATKARSDADWDARGDAINDEIDATWAALPMTEVRERFASIPGQLRGYLTVVPETRWLKHTEHQTFFHDETTAHYEEHRARPRRDPRGSRDVNLRELLEEEAIELPGAEPSLDPDGSITWSPRQPTLRSRVRRRLLSRIRPRPSRRRRSSPDARRHASRAAAQAGSPSLQKISTTTPPTEQSPG